MSFRNISQKNSFLVLRTRPKIVGDEHLWQNIYPKQVKQAYNTVRDFAVENWIAILAATITGIAAGVAGFFLGQKYSTLNIAKQFSEGVLESLPKKVREGLRTYIPKI